MKENLIHYRTCVCNINYHVVWSVKYRRKVLTADVEEYMNLKNNESEENAMCKLVEDYANEQKRIMICELVHDCALSAEAGADKLGMAMIEFAELMKQYGYSIPEPA